MPSEGLRLAVLGVAQPPETFVERLLDGLRGAGVDVVVLGSVPPPSAWLAGHGFGWQRLPWVPPSRALARTFRAAGPGDPARACQALRPLDLADEPPDVVYVPWINSLVDHPEVFDWGPPVVVSCRGSMVAISPWHPDRPERRGALREVFQRVAAVHCVSEAMMRDAEALGMPPDRAVVIRPAVDVAAFRPASSPDGDRLHAIGVGSLLWLKDYETALVGVRRALDAGIDIDLTILGEGPDRERLLFTADDLGLGSRVVLPGRRPPAEVASRLREADVFVHTSTSEGISNAVLEAMASGLAVVSTDVGGMGEVITDGVDGLLVGPRDSAAVGEALVRLGRDRELARTLGDRGRDRVVSSFRLEGQVAAFHRLLGDVGGAAR